MSVGSFEVIWVILGSSGSFEVTVEESDMVLQAWPFNRLTLTNNHKNLIEMIKYLVLWIRVKHLNSISKAETVCRKFILDIRSRDVHSKSRFNHYS